METDLPNIRHLRVCREVARQRSVSAAAASEHLSQPAVTQAVAKLEAALGVTLFDRRSDGMHATAIGAAFLDRVERALEHLAVGAREAARISGRQGARGFPHFDRLLTVAQLRSLSAMAEASSFSMAARNIGVSQPSLHRAARNLEKLSGIPLFESAEDGVALTPAALAFAQRATLFQSELRQGFDEIAITLGRDSTAIIVGSLPLARTSILPNAIDAMVRERTGVQLRVVDGPYPELLRLLRRGDIDFMIGALRFPAPTEDIRQERLFDDPLAIVVGRNHPLANKKRVELKETLTFPWVAPPIATPAGTYLYEKFGFGALAESPVRVVSSSLVLIRGLLAIDDYLTIISLHQISHEHAKGELKAIAIDLPDSRRPIGLTMREGWRPTATQSRFLDLVRAAAASAIE